MDDLQPLLRVFKALANENRLKLIAILADGDCTVRQLAELVDLKEPTVSEHLAILKDAGLVTMRADGNFRVYAFNATALNTINEALFSREKLAALVDLYADSAQPDDHERRILRNYFAGDRLKTIPAVRKNLEVVLRWLTQQFEVGIHYPEREVNAVLLRYHDDYATLRRELVGYHLLQRENGIYWRPAADPKDTA
ncbi:MAG: metalloregulator ArsR/SmtB family transcription factor [Armatimonadetes bacterium]|nr:metalloregulator ArsR/SmtB family transcription factor [Anaerolineae bacterium]